MRDKSTLALALLLLWGAVRGVRAECATGELQCACVAAGGVWKEHKPPLEPVCTFNIRHQGGWRLFNVYLPRGYDAHKPYPTWVHLHGVYWGTMDNISERMGFPVLATEATAVWDSLATGPYRDAAVIVYPQALAPGGDTNKRTFWNIPFWHCSVGVCTDPNIDDVGFIEKVLLLLPTRLAVDRRRVYMSGTSAGGMMLHNLLCTSSVVTHHLAAAVDLIGGVGAGVKATCRPPERVPLRIVHGETDTVLPFDRGAEVDGAQFMSTKDAAAMWKELHGCAADAERPGAFADATATTCSALCAKPGELELCQMKGIGHQLDIPYRGYPFSVAWQFFQAHTRK